MIYHYYCAWILFVFWFCVCEYFYRHACSTLMFILNKSFQIISVARFKPAPLIAVSYCVIITSKTKQTQLRYNRRQKQNAQQKTKSCLKCDIKINGQRRQPLNNPLIFHGTVILIREELPPVNWSTSPQLAQSPRTDRCDSHRACEMLFSKWIRYRPTAKIFLVTRPKMSNDTCFTCISFTY